MVIISVFQTDDAGSIPATRSKKKTQRKLGFLFGLSGERESKDSRDLPVNSPQAISKRKCREAAYPQLNIFLIMIC